MTKDSTKEEIELIISLDKRDDLDETHQKFTFCLRRDGILNLTRRFYNKLGHPTYFHIDNTEDKERNDFVLRYENTEDK